MPGLLRVLTLLSLVVVLLVGVLWLTPSPLLAGLGLDWRDLPEVQRRRLAEAQRAEDLKRGDDIVLKRTQERKEVIRQVLAGQLTLLQAALCFRRLNRTPADLAVDVRRNFPAASEGESLCLQVIQWTETELTDRGETDLGPVRRLRTELAEMLRRNGTINLPQE
jgi:hypothetical protein